MSNAHRQRAGSGIGAGIGILNSNDPEFRLEPLGIRPKMAT
jgi:hypothetical protein